jgi:pSer/pThr/pTyr-binding forkhead associated (FHA) protein
MTKCGRCGQSNVGRVIFCQFCGTRLAPDRLPERGPEPPSIEVSIGPAAPAPVRPGYDNGFRLTVVHRDGTDGTSYSLLGDQIDLGRSEGDLLFDDPHLAPRHARISLSAGGRVLAPLETRNGVYVRLRSATELGDGDHILLGKQVLRFESVPEIERNLRPAVEHGVALFGTPTRPAWCRLRQVTAAGVSRDVYYVSRGEVVLGREQADIVFSDDEFMSRRHALLSLRGGKPRLEDLGSSNGTFLRLRRMHNLSAGDLIRIGDELLRFEPG